MLFIPSLRRMTYTRKGRSVFATETLSMISVPVLTAPNGALHDKSQASKRTSVSTKGHPFLPAVRRFLESSADPVLDPPSKNSIAKKASRVYRKNARPHNFYSMIFLYTISYHIYCLLSKVWFLITVSLHRFVILHTFSSRFLSLFPNL